MVNVDLIRLYYFDENNNEVILLTGASKNLIIEKEKSRETFVDRIYRNKKFYMDACYKNTCQKMELSYFNDFKNDNLINNKTKSGSLTSLNDDYIEGKSQLVNSLILNGFKLSDNNSYFLEENNITYNYLQRMDVVQMTYDDGENKLIMKIYLNSKSVLIDMTCSNSDKDIYISDYSNKKDKNYKLFKKYYDKFLAKYFQDFLVV